MTEPEYTDKGIPTFDYVRDKIEGRQATGDAAAELVGDPKGTDQQFEERERAGRDKLAEIRKAMRGE